ncbi:hypothetical protein BZA05DRAFT_433489 [Tricharina praecox]|uniref:uncharacterized protein n=1 Tax=Tricharina praecox TaxID=43433 RepID=UPI00221F3D9E|nr:uncharacterized protein BZA05DRAFT_433489 [Tricharina praecox]KAI5858123.1 hypothetical protein BZA05DRAFT_433489 [Tricharina praecox]
MACWGWAWVVEVEEEYEEEEVVVEVVVVEVVLQDDEGINKSEREGEGRQVPHGYDVPNMEDKAAPAEAVRIAGLHDVVSLGGGMWGRAGQGGESKRRLHQTPGSEALWSLSYPGVTICKHALYVLYTTVFTDFQSVLWLKVFLLYAEHYHTGQKDRPPNGLTFGLAIRLAVSTTRTSSGARNGATTRKSTLTVVHHAETLKILIRSIVDLFLATVQYRSTYVVRYLDIRFHVFPPMYSRVPIGGTVSLQPIRWDNFRATHGRKGSRKDVHDGLGVSEVFGCCSRQKAGAKVRQLTYVHAYTRHSLEPVTRAELLGPSSTHAHEPAKWDGGPANRIQAFRCPICFPYCGLHISHRKPETPSGNNGEDSNFLSDGSDDYGGELTPSSTGSTSSDDLLRENSCPLVQLPPHGQQLSMLERPLGRDVLQPTVSSRWACSMQQWLVSQVQQQQKQQQQQQQPTAHLPTTQSQSRRAYGNWLGIAWDCLGLLGIAHDGRSQGSMPHPRGRMSPVQQQHENNNDNNNYNNYDYYYQLLLTTAPDQN